MRATTVVTATYVATGIFDLGYNEVMASLDDVGVTVGQDCCMDIHENYRQHCHWIYKKIDIGIKIITVRR